MRVKDYLKELTKNEKVTFIIVDVEVDEHTPFTHNIYKTTPIRNVREWLEQRTAGYAGCKQRC